MAEGGVNQRNYLSYLKTLIPWMRNRTEQSRVNVHTQVCDEDTGYRYELESKSILSDRIFLNVDIIEDYRRGERKGGLTYEQIEIYLHNGQVHTSQFRMNIIDVIHVQLKNEPDRTGNCAWLWHGTRTQNLDSILQQGIQLPKKGSGGLVGDGIYFADRASKSAQYCRNGNDAEGFLLLCRVYLGATYQAWEPDNKRRKNERGYDSIMCTGEFIPDPDFTEELAFAKIPLGPSVPNPDMSCVIGAGKLLKFNEYVVYSPSQVQIRYIIRFSFSN